MYSESLQRQQRNLGRDLGRIRQRVAAIKWISEEELRDYQQNAFDHDEIQIISLKFIQFTLKQLAIRHQQLEEAMANGVQDSTSIESQQQELAKQVAQMGKQMALYLKYYVEDKIEEEGQLVKREKFFSSLPKLTTQPTEDDHDREVFYLNSYKHFYKNVRWAKDNQLLSKLLLINKLHVVGGNREESAENFNAIVLQLRENLDALQQQGVDNKIIAMLKRGLLQKDASNMFTNPLLFKDIDNLVELAKMFSPLTEENRNVARFVFSSQMILQDLLSKDVNVRTSAEDYLKHVKTMSKDKQQSLLTQNSFSYYKRGLITLAEMKQLSPIELKQRLIVLQRVKREGADIVSQHKRKIDGRVLNSNQPFNKQNLSLVAARYLEFSSPGSSVVLFNDDFTEAWVFRKTHDKQFPIESYKADSDDVENYARREKIIALRKKIGVNKQRSVALRNKINQSKNYDDKRNELNKLKKRVGQYQNDIITLKARIKEEGEQHYPQLINQIQGLIDNDNKQIANLEVLPEDDVRELDRLQKSIYEDTKTLNEFVASAANYFERDAAGSMMSLEQQQLYAPEYVFKICNDYNADLNNNSLKYQLFKSLLVAIKDANSRQELDCLESIYNNAFPYEKFSHVEHENISKYFNNRRGTLAAHGGDKSMLQKNSPFQQKRYDALLEEVNEFSDRVAINSFYKEADRCRSAKDFAKLEKRMASGKYDHLKYRGGTKINILGFKFNWGGKKTGLWQNIENHVEQRKEMLVVNNRYQYMKSRLMNDSESVKGRKNYSEVFTRYSDANEYLYWERAAMKRIAEDLQHMSSCPSQQHYTMMKQEMLENIADSMAKIDKVRNEWKALSLRKNSRRSSSSKRDHILKQCDELEKGYTRLLREFNKSEHDYSNASSSLNTSMSFKFSNNVQSQTTSHANEPMQHSQHQITLE